MSGNSRIENVRIIVNSLFFIVKFSQEKYIVRKERIFRPKKIMAIRIFFLLFSQKHILMYSTKFS